MTISGRLRRSDRYRWPSSLDEAKREQLRLRDRVVAKDDLGLVRRVAGLDVHYDPARHLACAAATVFGLPITDPDFGLRRDNHPLIRLVRYYLPN